MIPVFCFVPFLCKKSLYIKDEGEKSKIFGLFKQNRLYSFLCQFLFEVLPNRKLWEQWKRLSPMIFLI